MKFLQDETFTEITTSGKLNQISDDQLKKSIIDYYRNYAIAVISTLQR